MNNYELMKELVKHGYGALVEWMILGYSWALDTKLHFKAGAHNFVMVGLRGHNVQDFILDIESTFLES